MAPEVSSQFKGAGDLKRILQFFYNVDIWIHREKTIQKQPVVKISLDSAILI
jgi:hypothetical protein